MMGYKRKLLRNAGKFKAVKFIGPSTKYAIQYKPDEYELAYEKMKEMREYFNVKHEYWGDSQYFYFQKRKDCLKQFAYCVLRWA